MAHYVSPDCASYASVVTGSSWNPVFMPSPSANHRPGASSFAPLPVENVRILLISPSGAHICRDLNRNIHYALLLFPHGMQLMPLVDMSSPIPENALFRINCYLPAPPMRPHDYGISLKRLRRDVPYAWYPASIPVKSPVRLDTTEFIWYNVKQNGSVVVSGWEIRFVVDAAIAGWRTQWEAGAVPPEVKAWQVSKIMGPNMVGNCGNPVKARNLSRKGKSVASPNKFAALSREDDSEPVDDKKKLDDPVRPQQAAAPKQEVDDFLHSLPENEGSVVSRQDDIENHPSTVRRRRAVSRNPSSPRTRTPANLKWSNSARNTQPRAAIRSSVRVDDPGFVDMSTPWPRLNNGCSSSSSRKYSRIAYTVVGNDLYADGILVGDTSASEHTDDEGEAPTARANKGFDGRELRKVDPVNLDDQAHVGGVDARAELQRRLNPGVGLGVSPERRWEEAKLPLVMVKPREAFVVSQAAMLKATRPGLKINGMETRPNEWVAIPPAGLFAPGAAKEEESTQKGGGGGWLHQGVAETTTKEEVRVSPAVLKTSVQQPESPDNISLTNYTTTKVIAHYPFSALPKPNTADSPSSSLTPSPPPNGTYAAVLGRPSLNPQKAPAPPKTNLTPSASTPCNISPPFKTTIPHRRNRRPPSIKTRSSHSQASKGLTPPSTGPRKHRPRGRQTSSTIPIPTPTTNVTSAAAINPANLPRSALPARRALPPKKKPTLSIRLTKKHVAQLLPNKTTPAKSFASVLASDSLTLPDVSPDSCIAATPTDAPSEPIVKESTPRAPLEPITNSSTKPASAPIPFPVEDIGFSWAEDVEIEAGAGLLPLLKGSFPIIPLPLNSNSPRPTPTVSHPPHQIPMPSDAWTVVRPEAYIRRRARGLEKVGKWRWNRAPSEVKVGMMGGSWRE